MRGLSGKIAIGLLIAGLAFAGAVWTTGWLAPAALNQRPKLANAPPLPPAIRSSSIAIPIAIPLSVLREAIEAELPPKLSGRLEIPLPPSLTGLELTWSLAREPFAISGGLQGLTIASALHGTLRAAGTPVLFPPMMGGPSGSQNSPPKLTGPPGFLFPAPGFPVQPEAPSEQSPTLERPDGPSDQRVDFRGRIALTARPRLASNWRWEPNLTSQVTITDASASVMSMTLNLSDQIKLAVERLLNEQISSLQIGNDPALEQAVRGEWAKLCRSISLGAGWPGASKLWLELRPTQAMAAQPRIDASSLVVTIGARAETRIVPAETKPDCAFPPHLDIVPQMEQGRLNLDLPIDMPFGEVSRLLEMQLKGKAFPVNESGAAKATIQTVKLAASGDRLLLSLGVKADETRRTWFGPAHDTTVHVWGRPRLDRERRALRFEDIGVDIESDTAFDVLGFFRRAGASSLQRALADNATIDLSPLVETVRQNLEAAVSEFQRNAAGIVLDAKVVDVRLADIRFDSDTLRVIAEADGAVRAEVTKLARR